MASKSARRPDRWYYFAYGSNMSLKQMAERCPSSLFMGKGRLDGYRWQINQRGVANIVECRGDFVEGLVYQIDARDKRQLDRSEGVALGFYSAEHLHILFWPLPNRGIKTFHVAKELEMDEQPDPKQKKHQPPSSSVEMVEALVYVSSTYKDDRLIRPEYIPRMEKAITDGRKMGLSEQFLSHIDRTIHRQVPPRRTNDAVRASYGPYEKLENDGASHEPYESLDSTRPRQEQHQPVSTIRPRYARYARVITVRPRYQDFHDLDGHFRYADERPRERPRERDRGRDMDRSPTGPRQSRARDERRLFTPVTTPSHIGDLPEQVVRYHGRGNSTPY